MSLADVSSKVQAGELLRVAESVFAAPCLIPLLDTTKKVFLWDVSGRLQNQLPHRHQLRGSCLPQQMAFSF